MSGIDVRDLANDELPDGPFPASAAADFRVYLAPETHRGTWQHAKSNVAVEICGVLVGRWKRDDNGPYAVVTNFIPCENASSKFAEVTFTHESWALINHEMDTRFADERIIGWYHSHPDFGIFLSDRDCFIQEHFFSGPGQIAYVIDPVRGLEGVFAWRAGKPTPLPHYWIGNTVRSDDTKRSNAGEKPRPKHESAPSAGEAAATPSRQGSSLDLAATILSWIALFLMGYLASGLRTQWEQDRIVEGTVYHYGYNKLIKIGLEDHLDRVRRDLLTLSGVIESLPDPDDDLTDDQAAAASQQRKLVAGHLMTCEKELGRIGERYGLSNVEREALFRLMQEKNSGVSVASSKATDAAADTKTNVGTNSEVKDESPSTESDSSPEKDIPQTTGESE